MYNNRYVTELSISEVKEYYEILREKKKITHEEATDFGICKERLIQYAYINIDKVNVLDKIIAERTKAIKELEYVKKQTGYADIALDLAIKALEQEPCEDTISRQAAIDAEDIK